MGRVSKDKRKDTLTFNHFNQADETHNAFAYEHRKPVMTSQAHLEETCKQWNVNDRTKIANAEYSKMDLISVGKDGTVVVLIRIFDILYRQLLTGNDVIILWAEQKHGDGRVSGTVIDHKSGSYTGIIKLFWTGETQIFANLATSIIHTCLKMKAIKKYGNAVYAKQKPWGIIGTFMKGDLEENTPCGANPSIFRYKLICNLTHINGNMPWFCGKPSNKFFSCSDISSFGSGQFDKSNIAIQDKIKRYAHGLIPSVVTVDMPMLTRPVPTTSCKDSPASLTWKNNPPSGFWLDKTWHMTNCKNDVLKDLKQYKKCLAGKTIYIIGDSTLRQYVNFIGTRIVEIHSNASGKYLSLNYFDKEHNMTLNFMKHEMPLHHPRIPANDIESIPQLLNDLAKEDISDLVVLVTYDSHFTAYPAYVYRHCQRELKKALKRLSIKNPSAKLFVRSPHLMIDDSRWFDTNIQLVNMDILKEEFDDMKDKVILLDTWEISVAHNSKHIHFETEALISEMHQFLSFIC
ncbi:Neurexophilin [Mactra antiquata]